MSNHCREQSDPHVFIFSNKGPYGRVDGLPGSTPLHTEVALNATLDFGQEQYVMALAHCMIATSSPPAGKELQHAILEPSVPFMSGVHCSALAKGVVRGLRLGKDIWTGEIDPRNKTIRISPKHLAWFPLERTISNIRFILHSLHGYGHTIKTSPGVVVWTTVFIRPHCNCVPRALMPLAKYAAEHLTVTANPPNVPPPVLEKQPSTAESPSKKTKPNTSSAAKKPPTPKPGSSTAPQPVLSAKSNKPPAKPISTTVTKTTRSSSRAASGSSEAGNKRAKRSLESTQASGGNAVPNLPLSGEQYVGFLNALINHVRSTPGLTQSQHPNAIGPPIQLSSDDNDDEGPKPPANDGHLSDSSDDSSGPDDRYNPAHPQFVRARSFTSKPPAAAGKKKYTPTPLAKNAKKQARARQQQAPAVLEKRPSPASSMEDEVPLAVSQVLAEMAMSSDDSD